MQHAERSDRITLRPLGLRLVLPYARRARGVGPARDLPAKRKRKRARAGRPMATHGAGSGGRREKEVAREPLGSLRQPPAGNGRWSRPTEGFSKRSASAGRRGDKDVEKERSPGRSQRGHQGMDCSEEGRWTEGSRHGHVPRERPRTGRAPGHPAGSRTPLPGRGPRQVTAHGFEL